MRKRSTDHIHEVPIEVFGCFRRQNDGSRCEVTRLAVPAPRQIRIIMAPREHVARGNPWRHKKVLA